MADNKRIPELPKKIGGEPTDKLAIYNEGTDTTYHIEVQDLIPSSDSTTDLWDSEAEYLEGAIVSYEGEAYIATNEPGNINKIPLLFPLYWTAVDKQTAASIKLWAAGLYTALDVSVYKIINGDLRLVRLASATRPYNSTDFDAELALGDWQIVSGAPLILSSPIVTAILNLDFALGADMIFSCPTNLIEEVAVVFVNEAKAKHFTLTINVTDVAGFLVFDATVISEDANWDNANKVWQPIETGKYKLTATYDNNFWWLERVQGFFI